MIKSYRYCTVLVAILFISLVGCASAPPQVAQLHHKEKEIIQSLHKSHLAIVDAYIKKRIDEFERFYFEKYGPTYYQNWKKAFPTKTKRPYDPQKDFPILYEDLVAEYLEISERIEKKHAQLRTDIKKEYSKALEAHKAIGDWLNSIEKLKATQRQGIDKLLNIHVPGLSLKKIDEVFQKAKQELEEKIKDINEKLGGN